MKNFDISVLFFPDSGPSVKMPISFGTEITFYISFFMKTDTSFSYLNHLYSLPSPIQPLEKNNIW